MNIYIIGCLSALLSAALWALGAILFKRLGDNLSPICINLGKSVFATICLGIMLLFINGESVSHRTFLYLGISGLLGITLGDTFYIKSLIELGPRLSLILTLLIPATTVLLALLILHERLSLIHCMGMLLTFSGVFMVLMERPGHVEKQIRNRIKGIKYGLLAIFSCAFSIIFSKLVIESTTALKATFIRQLVGAAGLIAWRLIRTKLHRWVKPLLNPVLLRNLVFAAFISTFLGTWLCLTALKYIDAAIATILNSTSPLFILPLSYFFLKERISLRSFLGSLIATIGVGVIISGGL